MYNEGRVFVIFVKFKHLFIFLELQYSHKYESERSHSIYEWNFVSIGTRTGHTGSISDYLHLCRLGLPARTSIPWQCLEDAQPDCGRDKRARWGATHGAAIPRVQWCRPQTKGELIRDRGGGNPGQQCLCPESGIGIYLERQSRVRLKDFEVL